MGAHLVGLSLVEVPAAVAPKNNRTLASLTGQSSASRANQAVAGVAVLKLLLTVLRAGEIPTVRVNPWRRSRREH